MLHMYELDSFNAFLKDFPKDIEKFTCLLDVTVTNLKKVRYKNKVRIGSFYGKRLRKLPGQIVIQ